MIDECMAGNIDMIITKSISRFARNTLTVEVYPPLKDKNIAVYFEKKTPIQQKPDTTGLFGTVTKPLVFIWCLNLCNENSPNHT